jgi:hypothetical protein
MKALQFIALVFGALALVPAGAHLFATPNKMAMTQADYFVAQGIYRGWALFGVVLFGNLIALAALAIVSRAQRTPVLLTLAALACQVAVLAIFCAFVFPANQVTVNWTHVPADWQHWRGQWEWGHAVNAVIAFAGYCALAASVLTTRK